MQQQAGHICHAAHAACAPCAAACGVTGPPRMTDSCSHAHALQSMIQLSRTQDEEVGDGTTSVIILGVLAWKLVARAAGMQGFCGSYTSPTSLHEQRQHHSHHHQNMYSRRIMALADIQHASWPARQRQVPAAGITVAGDTRAALPLEVRVQSTASSAFNTIFTPSHSPAITQLQQPHPSPPHPCYLLPSRRAAARG